MADHTIIVISFIWIFFVQFSHVLFPFHLDLFSVYHVYTYVCVCVCMYNSFIQTPAHIYIHRERSLKIEASYDVGNIYFYFTDEQFKLLAQGHPRLRIQLRWPGFNDFTCSVSVSFLPGLSFFRNSLPPCCVVFWGLSVKGSCPALPKSK